MGPARKGDDNLVGVLIESAVMDVVYRSEEEGKDGEEMERINNRI